MVAKGQKWKSAGLSFRFDASRLDDRPPLVDLGLLQRAKRLRGLLVARWQLLPQLGQPMLTVESPRASRTAALSLAMISCGVPLGAQSPCHIAV